MMSDSAEQAMLVEARTEVTYADHKASMLLAALGIGFGASLGGLLAGDWRPSDLGSGQSLWWIGAGLAAVSVVAAAAAVWPRYRTPRKPPQDIYFWGQAAAFDSFESFTRALDHRPPDTEVRTRHQLWELSRIVRRKYLLVRIAFLSAGGAVLVFAVSVGFSW